MSDDAERIADAIIAKNKQWKECSRERYDEMLEILPPALWNAKGFLVGEPAFHRMCAVKGEIRACYQAFSSFGGKYYEGPCLTVPEFNAFDPFKDLPK
ncbi:hypothetical protein [Rhodopseudomonas palustris]|uniref:hypothetical protein n=1 Tax=Rhodopseudomonas palustris TaxID=1076 RepID=UPI000D1AC135|nr:hypothetical protein [Rhodopseudomonas palustris]AVT83680.1 hypothetical protein RPYSC3_48200 [Rhodopseudomonas palustris]